MENIHKELMEHAAFTWVTCCDKESTTADVVHIILFHNSLRVKSHLNVNSYSVNQSLIPQMKCK